MAHGARRAALQHASATPAHSQSDSCVFARAQTNERKEVRHGSEPTGVGGASDLSLNAPRKRCVCALNVEFAFRPLARSQAMCLQVRDALRVGCIGIHKDFFCNTTGTREMLKILEDELRNFCVLVEAAKTPFGKCAPPPVAAPSMCAGVVRYVGFGMRSTYALAPSVAHRPQLRRPTLARWAGATTTSPSSCNSPSRARGTTA